MLLNFTLEMQKTKKNFFNQNIWLNSSILTHPPNRHFITRYPRPFQAPKLYVKPKQAVKTIAIRTKLIEDNKRFNFNHNEEEKKWLLKNRLIQNTPGRSRLNRAS